MTGRLLRLRHNLFAVAVWLLACALPAPAAGPAARGVSGTYRGRVITELFLHRQALARRTADPRAALSAFPKAAVRDDIGEIAVIEASRDVVVQPNLFDLQGRTVRLDPVGAGFAVSASALRFDEAGRVGGVPLALADDDFSPVRLPFDFEFFGAGRREVFVHSDGNLSFEESDARTSERSLSRLATGPPRIAPLFADLDPSRSGAEVRVRIGADRAVITWDSVPVFRSLGTGPRQTFQAVLHADGAIEFHYRIISINDAVVAVVPGRSLAETTPLDLSAGSALPVEGGLAEVFKPRADLDIFAAAQRFYSNHGDAYDFLIFFNNTSLTAGPGSFAFEVNVRNGILGIGDLLSGDPLFDFGADFGSARRLTSFLNMGPLSNYPDDPADRIPFLGENSTISVLGQEVGHRWLAYVDFLDPLSGERSSNLLGRQRAHWNFFFNSNASVVEGNRIVDHGPGVSPRFETVEAVARYSELGQYLMGLRRPEDVPPSFLVENPSGAGNSSRGRPPQSGVRFDGVRKEIPLDVILAAEGPRLPPAEVSEKEFNFAFVLLVDESADAVPERDRAKIDRIRASWEEFFEQAVGGRAAANTALVEQLHLSAWPGIGVLAGVAAPISVTIDVPGSEDLEVLLTSDSGAVTVPAAVTILAGETAASFNAGGVSPGLAVVRAEAGEPGFDTAAARVLVSAVAALRLEVVSGDGQTAAVGQALPQPIAVVVRDAARLPYPGIEVEFLPSPNGRVEPARARADERGRVETVWRMGAFPGPARLVVRPTAAPEAAIEVRAVAAESPPGFRAEGVVSAAGFNLGASAANTALAPGGLVSLFGAGLSLETAVAGEFPLPRELAGTRLLVNGVAVPLLLVSPTQINFQLPFEVPEGEIVLTVLTPAGAGEAVHMQAASSQPGLFFDAGSGIGAIVHHADATLAWDRPTRAGEFIEIFATGLGAVDGEARTGERAIPFLLSETLAEVFVRIGERRIPALFSGLAPLFAGLYQVNVQVPVDLAPGRHEILLEVDGRLSNAAAIEVR